MQAIYLINRVASGIAATWRNRRIQRLTIILSQELAHADPRVQADIALWISHAKSSARALPTTGQAAKTVRQAPTAAKPAVASVRSTGGFRTSPLPGLPTHMQYLNS